MYIHAVQNASTQLTSMSFMLTSHSPPPAAHQHRNGTRGMRSKIIPTGTLSASQIFKANCTHWKHLASEDWGVMRGERNLIQTMDYNSPWFSARNWKSGLWQNMLIIIRKWTPRGAEWYKFQLQSTFQWGVISMETKPWTIHVSSW